MLSSVLTAVVMPCLQNRCAMSGDQPTNGIQLSSAKTVAACQLDRFEPKLAGAVLSLDVHVRGIVAVEAGEEKPIRPGDALDPWHSGIPLFQFAQQ